MSVGNQHETQRSPRRHRATAGAVCFAGLSLGVYFALMGYGVWKSRPRGESEQSTFTSPVVVQPVEGISTTQFALTSLRGELADDARDSPLLRDLINDEVFHPQGPIDDSRIAARFASSCANDRCRNVWGRSPFAAEMYSASERDGRWHWGEYDPAGRDGFSAEVSFASDASDVKVRIYFSSDTVDYDVFDAERHGRRRNGGPGPKAP